MTWGISPVDPGHSPMRFAAGAFILFVNVGKEWNMKRVFASCSPLARRRPGGLVRTGIAALAAHFRAPPPAVAG